MGLACERRYSLGDRMDKLLKHPLAVASIVGIGGWFLGLAPRLARIESDIKNIKEITRAPDTTLITDVANLKGSVHGLEAQVSALTQMVIQLLPAKKGKSASVTVPNGAIAIELVEWLGPTVTVKVVDAEKLKAPESFFSFFAVRKTARLPASAGLRELAERIDGPVTLEISPAVQGEH